MDEVRLKDELLAKLSNQLDQAALQVIDGALSSGTGDGLRSLCDGPDNAYGHTGRV